MDIENEKITIEKDGQEVECDVLFTFTLDETGKVYIGFTDHSKDVEGNELFYAKSYDPVYGTILDLDSQEIEIVNNVLNDIKEKRA